MKGNQMYEFFWRQAARVMIERLIKVRKNQPARNGSRVDLLLQEEEEQWDLNHGFLVHNFNGAGKPN
jgi:hypothetical protein